ncbi:MAG: hypothetical protein KatS3mg105_2733 [Gemmatales bacterium]|nr:MAG: hypothetical protein KatS3mg105_2733 [Gemmatales bacterium]
MRRQLQVWLAVGILSSLVVGLWPGGQTTRAAKFEPKIEPLKHKKYTEKIPGTNVTFEMVPIPGGVFLMGSPETEKGRHEDEGPQHPVEIRPFWMGKCEVTWDEFDVYWQEMRQLRAKKPPKTPQEDAVSGPTPAYVDETYGHGRDGHPVLCMTHHCAMEYCRWLSEKTGKYYRLPTEAEWEYAARAGDDDGLFLWRRSQEAGRICLVRRKLRRPYP